MSNIRADRIPRALALRKQWVCWRNEDRDGGPTKVPYQYNGMRASSTDSATWNGFTAMCTKLDTQGYGGLGFVFSPDDEFCGVDLDGCRNEGTGEALPWAKEIIRTLDSYTEVSPSKTGFKVFVVGKNPMGTGRNLDLPDKPRISEHKSPGIEVYDRARYFAMTGWRVAGLPTEPQPRQPQLDQLCERFWPVAKAPIVQHDFRSEEAIIERARKYIALKHGAVSHQKGHNQTFAAACVLVRGFGLSRGDALALLREYNQRCDPPWSDKDLEHKIDSAAKQSGEINYLRNAAPERWQNIQVPDYACPEPTEQIQVTTLAKAAQGYVDKMRRGEAKLIELGLGAVDHAVGGGVEAGEMIVLAARPSHGKSAMALQCVHTWTFNQRPGLIISEEMSALALGKRTIQYISDVPRESWDHKTVALESDIRDYDSTHADAFVIESVGTTAAAIEQIEKHVAEHQIQWVVIDYAQLLKAEGQTTQDRVSNTSKALKRIAKKHKLVLLLLAQMNRRIEERPKYIPVMSDIADSSQMEKDADVILFIVWPHKINSQLAANEYMFFVAKNRERETNESVVKCRFLPSRQMVMDEKKPEPKRYSSIDEWNNS